MQTIITPTDFSEASLNAVYYAADMAMALHANLLVLHATESAADAKEICSVPKNDEIKSEKKLMKLKDELIKRTHNKVPVQATQVIGFIENEIIKICNYKNPLTVVMATKGASAKDHFFLESITVYLSKNLKNPVIVVPNGMRYMPIKKILLATDLEHLNDLPFDNIIKIASALNAQIDIVHVYKNEDRFEVMSGRISELSNHLKNLKPQFHFIKNDDIQKAILDFAQKNGNDLILTFPKKHLFFHKSESKKLIYKSPFAVMTIQ